MSHHGTLAMAKSDKRKKKTGDLELVQIRIYAGDFGLIKQLVGMRTEYGDTQADVFRALCAPVLERITKELMQKQLKLLESEED